MCPSQALHAPSGFRHERRVVTLVRLPLRGQLRLGWRREAQALLIPVELRPPRTAAASTNGGHHTVRNGSPFAMPSRYASHHGLTAHTPHLGLRATQT
jgi:hypothetical protein